MVSTLLRAHSGGQGLRPEIKPCPKVHTTLPQTAMMAPAGGMDWQAKRLEGKIFTVRFIDSAGQIHLEETGIALIPGVNEYSFFFSAD